MHTAFQDQSVFKYIPGTVYEFSIDRLGPVRCVFNSVYVLLNIRLLGLV